MSSAPTHRGRSAGGHRRGGRGSARNIALRACGQRLCCLWTRLCPLRSRGNLKGRSPGRAGAAWPSATSPQEKPLKAWAGGLFGALGNWRPGYLINN